MALPINQILCGDCIEIIQTFPNLSIDCMIVDPPYSSGARQDADRTTRGKGKMIRNKNIEWFSHDNMSTLGFNWFMRHLLISLKSKMKPNAVGYLFSDWRQYPIIAQIIESTGYRLNDLIVWDKKHFGLGSFYRNQHELISFFSNGAPPEPQRKDISNIIQIKNIHSKERIHPTQKPVELLRIFIETSTKENDIILDPMCGSGSTLIAAKQLARRYIGIEINSEYHKIAEARIAAYPVPLTEFI